MTKLLTTAAMLVALIAPAMATPTKDLLLVVLQDTKGKESMHYQSTPHASCKQFLVELRKQTQRKMAVMFTFEAPGFNENGDVVEEGSTGKVLEAHCIRPDGTIEHQ